MSTSRLVRASAVVGAGMLFVMGVPGTAAAQAPPQLSGADTSWMLISTALVLLMTPALAFFYGGLVRSKNALNTMMMSIISLGFVGVLWAMFGYSLAFSPGSNWIGDTSNFFLRGVAPPEITTRHIYVGIIPFVLIQLCALVVLWFAPGLATWLPRMLYGG